MITLSDCRQYLDAVGMLTRHPAHATLVRILTGNTALTSAGYPFICEDSFHAFTETVPHLFQDGSQILDWVTEAEACVSALDNLAPAAQDSLTRAIKVVRNMVFTAAVTAPPDLWLLRQVLGVHREVGIAAALLTGESFQVSDLADRLQLDARQLQIDFDFLHARGLLLSDEQGYVLNDDGAMQDCVEHLQPLPAAYRDNRVRVLCDWFEKGADAGQDADELDAFFQFDAPHIRPQLAWLPNRYQIELGYRLLPLVLALRFMNQTAGLKVGARAESKLPNLTPHMVRVLEAAGLLHQDSVTVLGARVFQRGPGPFGIIGAYYPYMNMLEKILHKQQTDHWVSRGENVAASQDANRKTFLLANDALDDFRRHHQDQFQLQVFIEHAVGKGEATRQRFERDGETNIRYFGADLEDDAIDEAVKQQQLGELPANMRFIRNADIGEPTKVIHAVQEQSLDTQQAVMMVGNGFHEIRNQTNEKMLEVFRGYCEAGIVLIFTEETALSDQDLLNTAWNTYHAGFRYVHDMSGQGLRPSWESEAAQRVWSWRKCARLAGYHVVDQYTTHTRTIYPTREPGRKNPSISVTYFCVPNRLADQLNLPGESASDR